MSSSNTSNTPVGSARSEELLAQRLDNLSAIQASGRGGFAYSYEGRTSVGDIVENESVSPIEPGSDGEASYRVAGRVVATRGHGKLMFFDVQDLSGTIQLWCDVRTLGADDFALLSNVDIGDIIGASGVLMRTRRGELSIRVDDWTLLTKALRPVVADRVAGLTDPDTRQRYRERDLIANPESRERFVLRSRTIASIRRFFDGLDFLEVETPTLQAQYGGAAARPFTTHHNALDADLYLRIATELYLKRCIVGGLERVYEIGKNFRNEGISRKHNPEFTVIEWYETYTDYIGTAARFEMMMATCARGADGSPIVSYGEHRIDMSQWARADFRQLLIDHAGIDLDERPDVQALGVAIGEDLSGQSWPSAVDRVFSVTVEPTLIQPTLVMDYPIELSPLAASHRTREGYVERWEAFACGMELANSFSELTDPNEQRARFEYQQQLAVAGDGEAHPMDEAFLSALEAGMAPTGGVGLGLDRLILILAEQSTIREVILFPSMRQLAVEGVTSGEGEIPYDHELRAAAGRADIALAEARRALEEAERNQQDAQMAMRSGPRRYTDEQIEFINNLESRPTSCPPLPLMDDFPEREDYDREVIRLRQRWQDEVAAYEEAQSIK